MTYTTTCTFGIVVRESCAKCDCMNMVGYPGEPNNPYQQCHVVMCPHCGQKVEGDDVLDHEFYVKASLLTAGVNWDVKQRSLRHYKTLPWWKKIFA